MAIQENNIKCENCGGNLVFSPAHSSLFCTNCHTQKEIIRTRNNIKHPLDYKYSNTNINNWKNRNVVYECKNCGGKVILENLEISSTCPYCNTSVVVKTESLPEYLPDSIIPFKFDKSTAKEMFKAGLKKKWFIPNKLKKTPPESDITGFYASAFSFDGVLTVQYSGVLNRDRGQDRGIEKVRVSGTISKVFKDLMIEATAQLTQSQFEAIGPFSFNDLVDYKEDFVRGFGTEYYNNSIQQTFAVAKQKMIMGIEWEILRKHDCDSVDHLTRTNTFSNEQFSYVLLPVYKFNYKYKKKDYCTMLNGQTGKVGSGYPKSGTKITFFVGFLLLIVLGIVLIVI